MPSAVNGPDQPLIAGRAIPRPTKKRVMKKSFTNPTLVTISVL